jgi:DNA polymerase I-like protein with 3'-5' exonuclease and polymerase domains
MSIVLDIETNMLHDTIWCCAVLDTALDTSTVFTKPEGLQEVIDNADKVIMHNGLGFDAPVLKRVWGTNIPLNKILDTLVVSRLVDPVLDGGHSLAAWGERLGFPKGDFTDFNAGYSEEMKEYCIQDTKVTAQLYRALLAETDSWHNKGEQSIHLEHMINALMFQQQRNGFKLDTVKATTLMTELKTRTSEINDILQERFPPIVKERYSEKTGKRLKDEVIVFNIGSRKQIAERLQECGVVFERKTDKGSIIVDESVLDGIDLPEAKLISEYLMLQKRYSQIDSWMEHVAKDGRVHGRVIANGAITGRMTHSNPNMGQVPSVNSIYGKECRELWCVDEGSKLVGVDLSGIELRCLAHYMQDDEWTKELLEGDIHTKNQLAAGLDSRAQAKTMIYATLYGAGAAKIGSIVGGGAKEGKRILDNFFNNTPKLKKLVDLVQKKAERGYLYGLDKRKLHIRSEHAALNTLLQSAGAIIAKQWCYESHKLFKKYGISTKVKQVAMVHDEIQFEVKEGYEELVAELAVEAAAKAGEVLNFRVPVAAETKTGINWYECH